MLKSLEDLQLSLTFLFLYVHSCVQTLDCWSNLGLPSGFVPEDPCICKFVPATYGLCHQFGFLTICLPVWALNIPTFPLTIPCNLSYTFPKPVSCSESTVVTHHRLHSRKCDSGFRPRQLPESRPLFSLCCPVLSKCSHNSSHLCFLPSHHTMSGSFSFYW